MFANKLNRTSILAIALCSVAMFTSCKSSESAYKKAYEKAQAQAAQNQTAVAEDNSQDVKISPVQTTPQPSSTTTDVANEPVRKENVQLISGSGLKAYSVVSGSFSLKANAEGRQSVLKSRGYDAQIVYNPNVKFYRVIAFTSDDKAAAVQSRNQMRANYSSDVNSKEAWLLYNGN